MVVRFYHYTTEESLAGIQYYETILPSLTGKFGCGVYFSRLGPRDLPLDKLAVNCFGAGGQARLRKGHLNCYIEVIVRNHRKVFEKCRAGGRDVFIYRGQMVLRQFAWRAGFVTGPNATLPMRRPPLQPMLNPSSHLHGSEFNSSPAFASESQCGSSSPPFAIGSESNNYSQPFAKFPPPYDPGYSQSGYFSPLNAPGSQSGFFSLPFDTGYSQSGNCFPPCATGSQNGNFSSPPAPGSHYGNYSPPYAPGSQNGKFPPPYAPRSQGDNFPPTDAPGSQCGNLPPTYTPGSQDGNFPPPYATGSQGGNFPPPYSPGSQDGNFPPPYSPGLQGGNISPPYAPGLQGGNFPPPYAPGSQGGNLTPPHAPGSNCGNFSSPYAPGSQGGKFPPPHAPKSNCGNFSPPHAPGSYCGKFPHPYAPAPAHDLDFSSTCVGEPLNDQFPSSTLRSQSHYDFTNPPANVAPEGYSIPSPVSVQQVKPASSSSNCHSASARIPVWVSYNFSPGREHQSDNVLFETGLENKENRRYFRRLGGKKRKVLRDSAYCVSAKRKRMNKASCGLVDNHKVTVCNVKSEVNDSGYLIDMNSSQVPESPVMRVNEDNSTTINSNNNGNISQVINQTVEILQKVCNWVGWQATGDLGKVVPKLNMSDNQLNLKWRSNEGNVSASLKDLRGSCDFFDVTLACEDGQIQCHKLLLSGCSPLFLQILRQNPHPHPLLYLKGVSFKHLLSVLDFMYDGEVNIDQEDLVPFMATAEELKVKGLTQSSSETDCQEAGSPVNVKRNIKEKEMQQSLSKSDLDPSLMTLDKEYVFSPVKTKAMPQSPLLPMSSSIPVKPLIADPEYLPSSRAIFPQKPFPVPNLESILSLVKHPNSNHHNFPPSFSYLLGDKENNLKEMDTEAGNDDPLESVQKIKQLFSDKCKSLIQKKKDDFFYCLMCEFRNVNKKNVRRHVETHVPSMRHFCNLCNRSYKNRNTLRSHNRVHKKETKDKSQFLPPNLGREDTDSENLEIPKVDIGSHETIQITPVGNCPQIGAGKLIPFVNRDVIETASEAAVNVILGEIAEPTEGSKAVENNLNECLTNIKTEPCD